jgi:Protein of unknown function (DUF2934)
MDEEMDGHDRRVREIAYFLWVGEGRPEGEAERHWRAAEAICDSDDPERKMIEGEPPGEPLEPDEPRASAAAVARAPESAAGRNG